MARWRAKRTRIDPLFPYYWDSLRYWGEGHGKRKQSVRYHLSIIYYYYYCRNQNPESRANCN
jgi:hypothetical protein